MPPSTTTLRILTYNIRHGRGLDDRIDLGRIADVIRAAEPDLAAIQEVDRCTRRSGGVDQAQALGELTGLHAAFGPAMDFSGGHYGVAVLSRAPIASAVVHPLPHAPDHEPRTSLEVVTAPTADTPPLRLISTHLDYLPDDTDRLAQAHELNQLFAPPDETPTLLAGDFNATPDSSPIGVISERWTDTWTGAPTPTFPTDEPTVKIDYIFARTADPWSVTQAHVLHAPLASDHHPVLAVLGLLRVLAPLR